MFLDQSIEIEFVGGGSDAHLSVSEETVTCFGGSDGVFMGMAMGLPADPNFPSSFVALLAEGIESPLMLSPEHVHVPMEDGTCKKVSYELAIKALQQVPECECGPAPKLSGRRTMRTPRPANELITALGL